MTESRHQNGSALDKPKPSSRSGTNAQKVLEYKSASEEGADVNKVRNVQTSTVKPGCKHYPDEISVKLISHRWVQIQQKSKQERRSPIAETDDDSLFKFESNPCLLQSNIPIFAIKEEAVTTRSALRAAMTCSDYHLGADLPRVSSVTDASNVCFVLDGNNIDIDCVLAMDSTQWRPTGRYAEHYYSADGREFRRVRVLQTQTKQIPIKAQLSSPTLLQNTVNFSNAAQVNKMPRGGSVQSSDSTDSFSETYDESPLDRTEFTLAPEPTTRKRASARIMTSGSSKTNDSDVQIRDVPLRNIFTITRYYSCMTSCVDFHRIISYVRPLAEGTSDDRQEYNTNQAAGPTAAQQRSQHGKRRMSQQQKAMSRPNLGTVQERKRAARPGTDSPSTSSSMDFQTDTVGIRADETALKFDDANLDEPPQIERIFVQYLYRGMEYTSKKQGSFQPPKSTTYSSSNDTDPDTPVRPKESRAIRPAYERFKDNKRTEAEKKIGYIAERNKAENSTTLSNEAYGVNRLAEGSSQGPREVDTQVEKQLSENCEKIAEVVPKPKVFPTAGRGWTILQRAKADSMDTGGSAGSVPTVSPCRSDDSFTSSNSMPNDERGSSNRELSRKDKKWRV